MSIDPQTLAMLGMDDPSKALTDLGIYSGAQKTAQAQQGAARPQTFDDLWTSKYGQPTSGVQGVKTEESGGNETFPLPANMPLTVNDPFLGPQYNPDIGEVLGFSPDGQVMTTKTHPYLASLARKGGMWSGGGDVGGNPDGGRADGAGNE